MDNWSFLIIAIAIIYIYYKLISFVWGAFNKSSGFERFFWFIIVIITLSFLFGGGSRYNSNQNNYYGGGDDDFDLFDNNQCDDYGSSWDNDCDDD